MKTIKGVNKMRKERNKVKTNDLMKKLYSTCAIFSLCCALCACSVTTENDTVADNTAVSDETTSEADSDAVSDKNTDIAPSTAPAKRKSRNRKTTEELLKIWER